MLFLALLAGIALGAMAGAAAAWTAARNRSDGMLSGMRDRAANAEISAQDAMASVRRDLAIAETMIAERDQRIITIEAERDAARAETAVSRDEAAAHREDCARLETQL